MARKYLSALPKAIELVSGMPSRKSAKSDAGRAAPVNVNVPRGSCCERRLNCCRRKSPPNVMLCAPWLQKVVVHDRRGLVAREGLLRRRRGRRCRWRSSSCGGPQFSGSWLLPVMPASPETFVRFGEVRRHCAVDPRLYWYAQACRTSGW